MYLTPYRMLQTSIPTPGVLNWSNNALPYLRSTLSLRYTTLAKIESHFLDYPISRSGRGILSRMFLLKVRIIHLMTDERNTTFITADFRALWQWTLCTCVVIPVEYAELKTLLGISKHNLQQFVVTTLFASSEEIAYSWSWWLRFPNLIVQSEIIAVMNTISTLICKACFSLGRLKSWRRECGQRHWAASCIWCVTVAAYEGKEWMDRIFV